MPKLTMMHARYWTSLLWLSVPVSAYFVGNWLQQQIDEDLTRYRNKSQMFGGRKCSVW